MRGREPRDSEFDDERSSRPSHGDTADHLADDTGLHREELVEDEEPGPDPARVYPPD